MPEQTMGMYWDEFSPGFKADVAYALRVNLGALAFITLKEIYTELGWFTTNHNDCCETCKGIRKLQTLLQVQL